MRPRLVRNSCEMHERPLDALQSVRSQAGVVDSYIIIQWAEKKASHSITSAFQTLKNRLEDSLKFPTPSPSEGSLDTTISGVLQIQHHFNSSIPVS